MRRRHADRKRRLEVSSFRMTTRQGGLENAGGAAAPRRAAVINPNEAQQTHVCSGVGIATSLPRGTCHLIGCADI